MHTRVAVVICWPTCYVFAALAMLIRVIGSDRAVNTIWHRKVRLKPVRLYNVTIVIRFGCLSSFQNCPNNFDVVRIGLAIVVWLPACLRFGAPRHVKIAKYNCVPDTSQNIGLILVRFFDARSLALFRRISQQRD